MKKELKDILLNVYYWESCPQEYKNTLLKEFRIELSAKPILICEECDLERDFIVGHCVLCNKITDSVEKEK